MSHPEDPGRVPDPFRLDPPPDLFALPVPPVEPTLSFDLDPPPALPEPSLLGGQTIDNARFKARGWISPYFSAQAGDESITIRVDDLARPELWCELILPKRFRIAFRPSNSFQEYSTFQEILGGGLCSHSKIRPS